MQNAPNSEQTEPHSQGATQPHLSAVAKYTFMASLPISAVLMLCFWQPHASLLEQIRVIISSGAAIRFIIVTQLDLFVVTLIVLSWALNYFIKPQVYFILVAVFIFYAVSGAFLMYARGLGGLRNLFFLIPLHEMVG